MKIAVTGSRGFIGRHVLATLARHDVDVVASGRPDGINDRPTTANLRWVSIDLANPPEDCFVALHRPDALVHLAWGGLPHYRSAHHTDIELPRQYTFLENMIGNGLRTLVVAGSCLEYGLQSGSLKASTETHPVTHYGVAKDMLRRKLEELQAGHTFCLTWARLFYTYGDGQPATSLLPALRTAALEGRMEFPMSGGEQLRDFLPVEEVARRLVAFALEPAERGTVNICSGQPVSVREFVEAQIRREGWRIKPKFGVLPYPDYEPMAFWGESSSLD